MLIQPGLCRPLVVLAVLAAALGFAPALHAADPSPASAAPSLAPPPPASPAKPPPPASAALTPQQAAAVLGVLKDDARRQQFIAVLESMARALPAVSAESSGTAPPAPGPSALGSSAPGPSASSPPAPVPAAGASAPAVAAQGTVQPLQPATEPVPPATAPAAPAAPKLPIPLAPNSVGAELIVGASEHLQSLSGQLVETAQAVTDFPLFLRWVRHMTTDEDARQEVIETSWKLAAVLAAALILEMLVQRALRRPVDALSRAAPDSAGTERPLETAADAPPEAADDPAAITAAPASTVTLLKRLPYVVARLLLDLLPILAVATTGYALVTTPLGSPSTTRLVILAVINAYVAVRTVIAVAKRLLAPNSPRLRLVHLSDGTAAYLTLWIARIATIAIFGYASAEVGLLLGLYRVAHDAMLKLVSLAVCLCVVIVVLQKRRAAADWIRPKPSAEGIMALARHRLAAVWHVVAVFYVLALWVVWALEVPDGFARLVRVFVATVCVAILARIASVGASGMAERLLSVEPQTAARYPGLDERARGYLRIVRGTANAAITGAALVILLQAWGLDSFSWFADGALGGRVVSTLMTIGLTVGLALVAWEAVNAAVQRHLQRLTAEGQAARSARLRTLLPLLRTTLLVSISLIAGLTVLSQIGVNIAPLLAGAGVVGLAIGFGSQKLVQDIITGLFLLLENAMQVGDVVSLGGMSGTVEALSVRAIRLRALDGSVHIVPFSAVTTVTNMTRDYGYAVMDFSVGLNEDQDRVADLVREVSRKMRAEPRWRSAIRDELEVWGIEKFVDLAYVMRFRVKTVAGERWAVARELNRRVKQRFDELAIESPFTSFRALSLAVPPTLNRKTEEAAE